MDSWKLYDHSTYHTGWVVILAGLNLRAQYRNYDLKRGKNSPLEHYAWSHSQVALALLSIQNNYDPLMNMATNLMI